jgi:hypothetical protein
MRTDAAAAVGFGAAPRPASQMRASNWCPLERGSLRGFFDLTPASGLVLRECTLHQGDNGRWIGLPGKSQPDNEGRHRDDPARPGKKAYMAVVAIPNGERRKAFQAQALATVDRMLRGGR